MDFKRFIIKYFKGLFRLSIESFKDLFIALIVILLLSLILIPVFLSVHLNNGYWLLLYLIIFSPFIAMMGDP